MSDTFEVHEVQRAGRSIDRVLRPATMQAALAALRDTPGALPLAGGTDLLLDLHRGGPGKAVTVVDLTTIAGFGSITEDGDEWVLGGGVTHNQIVQHAGIRDTALPLAQACLEVGSPQLRNRATIAGNLATASPANDTISALMALAASVELQRVVDDGSTARRTVAVTDFFEGFRSTVLEPDELITAIRVPKLAANERGLWVKLGLRRAQAISVVHGGMVVGLDDGIVSSARLALGSVAATVIVVEQFAEALVGRPLDEQTIAGAAGTTEAAVAPIDDVRATADYRNAGVRELVT
ncbi:MAG: FAD binding domain-containing protein, partial [Acidimicrobiales bacterium]